MEHERTDSTLTFWFHYLSAQEKHHSRWMVIAALSTALVLVIAALAKALGFAVVAAFLAFASFTKWKEWNRVRTWLLAPPPASDQEKLLWAKVLQHEMSRKPLWEKLATWVAVGVVAMMYVLVTVEVFAFSGFWMRVLYASSYCVLAVVLFANVLLNRREAARLRREIRVSSERWKDST
jgi:cell division protein FtsW (lipid II flippase)